MSKRKFTVGSRWVLVSGWLGLLGYGCVATPADDNDDGRQGTGGGFSGSAGSGVSGTFSGAAGTVSGSAGVGVGGTPSTGGTAGTPATGGALPGGAGSGVGGTDAGSAGVAGTPAGGTAGAPGGSGPGGSAGAGGASGANTDPMCKSISNNAACTAAVGDGKMCPMMPCGLGDSGRRDCNCQVNWTCTSCNFANSPVMTKPANAETPCSGVVNGMPCAMDVDSPLSVCNNSANTPDDPYCMCSSDPRNAANPAEWNCDAAPSSW